VAVLDLLALKFELFLVLFTRIAGLFFLFPLYGERAMPTQMKIGIALFLAYFAFPTTSHLDFRLPTTLTEMTLALAGEVLIGMMIGFTLHLLLGAIQLAGQFIGFQMGFAIVNVIDPTTGAEVSLIGKYQEIVAMMLFFTLGLDHLFFAGIVESFRVVPPLGIRLTSGGLDVLLAQAVRMWIVAVKIAAPVTVALFATNVAMGLMARTVPQMNIFMIGFPVTIGVGLLVLGLSVPLFVHLMNGLLGDMRPVMDRMLFALR
jgi:flagellar biosynthetic protein FliR